MDLAADGKDVSWVPVCSSPFYNSFEKGNMKSRLKGKDQNLFFFCKKRIIFAVLLSFKGIVMLKNLVRENRQMESRGIEPRALCVSKAHALPLSYTPISMKGC